ncbi:MAG: ATP-binding protein [Acidimicrobiia bacterium]
MRRRLLFNYLTITSIVLVSFGVVLGAVFSSSERRQLRAGLQHDAFSFVIRAQGPLTTLDSSALENLQRSAISYQRRTEGRVVIVDKRGTLLIDSESTVAAVEPRSFSDRSEIATALAGGEANGDRYSKTLGTTLVYTAVPVVSGDQVIGAVRVSYPSTYVDGRVRRVWLFIIVAGVVVLALVFAVSALFARSLARPLEALEHAAERIGDGDLTARAEVPENPHEVRVLAERFNQTADRLEALLQSQRDFVADASHQLRTPLTALRLRIESLGYAAESGAAEDVDAALAEVTRLASLVNGLLTLARAEQDTAAPQALSLAPIVEERVQSWGPLLDERGVNMAIIVGTEHVLATPGHLDQVFDNLINNALEVTPAGRGIEIRATRAGERVVVAFGDGGPGMLPEQRARAFDRFWRAPDARRGAGSGLGLAIVAQLVQLDGGHVELGESHLGGLEVRITLPSAVSGFGAAPPRRHRR